MGGGWLHSRCRRVASSSSTVGLSYRGRDATRVAIRYHLLLPSPSSAGTLLLYLPHRPLAQERPWASLSRHTLSLNLAWLELPSSIAQPNRRPDERAILAKAT